MFNLWTEYASMDFFWKTEVFKNKIRMSVESNETKVVFVS